MKLRDVLWGFAVRTAAIVAATVWLVTVSGLSAAATAWTPTSIRGVVLYLLDGKWEEVTLGQPLTQAKLRTLRSGRLSITGPSVILDVGPNSALQVALRTDGSAGSIDQYLGSIKIAALKTNGGLTVHAGTVTLTSITGELSVLVADGATSIVVESGTAAISGPNGKKTIDTGTYSADASGIVVEQLGTTTTSAVANAAPETSNAGGNGTANAAGNGNSGGGNSGGGNGGGGNGGGGNGGGNNGGNGGGDGGNGNGNGGGNNGNGGGGGGNNGNGNGNGKNP
jgi:hypothetical protein